MGRPEPAGGELKFSPAKTEIAVGAMEEHPGNLRLSVDRPSLSRLICEILPPSPNADTGPADPP
jgi:hypothetical protein